MTLEQIIRKPIFLWIKTTMSPKEYEEGEYRKLTGWDQVNLIEQETNDDL